MSNPCLMTFGCRLNRVESDVMQSHAAAAGLGDAIIVNTCAVTTEATRQARQAIRRARREHPAKPIIVAGCAAQVDAASFARMPEVTMVWGNREKLDRASYRAAALAIAADRARDQAHDRFHDSLPGRVAVGPLSALAETAAHLIQEPWNEPGHEAAGDWTRAFVQVQQGCDHRCTFCVIPSARGANRGVPPADIVARVRALVEPGYAEVVLTGVDICSYGADLGGGIGLGRLSRLILDDVPALKRLRLSSLDPGNMDAELFRAFAEHDRLMPHLHLSLQAGHDLILKRMNRRHRVFAAMRVRDAALKARADAIFGADLIAGFPTETVAQFEATRETVRDRGIALMHVFPYSPRPGTPAALMPAVPPARVRARARRLREDGAQALDAYLAARVGGTADVLIEGKDTGLREHYVPVRLLDGAGGFRRGQIVRAHIVGRDGTRLVGRTA